MLTKLLSKFESVISVDEHRENKYQLQRSKELLWVIEQSLLVPVKSMEQQQIKESLLKYYKEEVDWYKSAVKRYNQQRKEMR